MKVIKLISLLLVLSMLGCMFVACEEDNGEATLLSFSQAQSVSAMKKYDGKKVTIIGYMSTLSPINGEFMYLMNLPYQSCPFCIPNTSQLSNTMAVYAKKNDGFEFTDRAIQVTGILDFGDYTDEFGYEYGYRIKDATYTVLDTSQMSDKLKLWQQLASTDVISEVYAMYEYLNFLCFWGTYTMEFESGKDYLWPTDALNFVKEDGYQYNYGYKDGYFDDIVATIESVDKEKFSALVDNVRRAQGLAERALEELEDGMYTMVPEYSDVFNDADRMQYRMDNQDEFDSLMEDIYGEFSNWLAEWEL